MRASLKSWIIALVLLFNVALAGYYLSLKTDFHVDEVFSYGHANSTQGAFMNPQIDSYFEDDDVRTLYHQWLSGKVFQNYLTVQEGEQFRYGHIWENLAKDVHPPLYFILLHTVCSFFPDVFSKWQAGGLNLVALLLTLLMLFKLSKLFFEDDLLALLPVVLYGFSNAAMGTALFLRMYMFQTLFAVCLIYETMKMLIENKVDAKRLGLIFAYSALGILTQYTSLVFSFIVAAVGCLVLLCRKQYALLIKYAVAMLLSTLVLFLVFPPALEVLLHSQRGVEVQGYVSAFGYNFIYLENRFQRILKVYQTELLSFRKSGYASGLLFIFIMGGTLLKLCGSKMRVITSSCLVISLGMSLFIALFMPVMGIYDLRYFSLVMPLFSVLSVLFVVRVAGGGGASRRTIIWLLSIGVLFNSLMADFSSRSAFAFQLTPDNRQFLNEIKGRKLLTRSHWLKFCFRNGIFFKELRGFFMIEDECLSNYKDMLEQADFVLVYNSWLDLGSASSEEPVKLCEGDYDLVRFKSQVCMDSNRYDWYDVIK